MPTSKVAAGTTLIGSTLVVPTLFCLRVPLFLLFRAEYRELFGSPSNKTGCVAAGRQVHYFMLPVVRQCVFDGTPIDSASTGALQNDPISRHRMAGPDKPNLRVGIVLRAIEWEVAECLGSMLPVPNQNDLALANSFPHEAFLYPVLERRAKRLRCATRWFRAFDNEGIAVAFSKQGTNEGKLDHSASGNVVTVELAGAIGVGPCAVAWRCQQVT